MGKLKRGRKMSREVSFKVIKKVGHPDGSPLEQLMAHVVPGLFDQYEKLAKEFEELNPVISKEIETKDFLVSICATFCMNMCMRFMPENTKEQQAITQSNELMDDISEGYKEMMKQIIKSQYFSIGKTLN